MKKLLLSTDFSPPADNALLYAIDLAKDLDATIEILYVSFTPLSTKMLVTPENAEVKIKQMSEYAQTKMDNLLKKIDKSRVIGQKIVYGESLGDKIADEAKQGNFDLIVMGMKGEHGTIDKWIGSVTTQVMVKSPCPVLAIPEKAVYKGIKKIALATELPSSEDIPIQQVSAFAKTLSAELEFVHVDNIVRRAIAYQPDQEKTTYFGRDYSIVTNPSIHNGLNEFVQKNKSDVLSLYLRKRKLWNKFFHISISKEMAFQTIVPLLIFHE